MTELNQLFYNQNSLKCKNTNIVNDVNDAKLKCKLAADLN
jgi:hypothetical protein